MCSSGLCLWAEATDAHKKATLGRASPSFRLSVSRTASRTILDLYSRVFSVGTVDTISTVQRPGVGTRTRADAESRGETDYATSVGWSFSGSGSSMVMITNRQNTEEAARNIKTAFQL